MMLVSSSNISIIPRSPFIIKKRNSPTRCHLSRKSGKQTFFSQRFALPPPTYVRLFPQYIRDCALLYNTPFLHIVSATGTDVAVEEPNSPVTDKESGGVLLESTAESIEATKKSSSSSDASPTTAQVKRSRPGRQSEMPPVKDEDLVPGTVFTGKVKSIMPFGAFVDFGAFTDGLIHVSQLSDNFVKDVGSVVSIGQEVKVRLVEANMQTGRISLSMRESDDINKSPQQKDAPSTASSDKPKPVRKNQSKPSQRKEEVKVSKFVKGQELQGTVKNLVRAGSFISLPEGEEGFLPTEEESSDGFSYMMGESSLQVGQEVTVRVLRISRGQVTLTMRTEEDDQKSDTMFGQGVVHAATNPFVLAFRQNKEIAAFLDEREKTRKTVNKSLKTGTSKEVQEVNQPVSEVQVQPMSTDEELPGVSTPVDEIFKVEETFTVEVSQEAVVTSPDEDQETEDPGTSEVEDGVVEVVALAKEVSTVETSEEVNVLDPDKESVEPSLLKIMDGAPLVAAVDDKATDEEASTATVSEEASVSIPDQEIIEPTTSTILDGAAQVAAPIEKISLEGVSKEVGVLDTVGDSVEPSPLKKVDGATQLAVPETEEISETSDAKIKESSDGGSDTVAEIADQLSSVLDTKMQDDVSSSEEVPVKEKASSDEEPESIESSLSQSVVEAIKSITEKAVDSSGSSDLQPSLSTAEQTTEEVLSSDGVENEELSGLNEEVVSQDSPLESPASEELDIMPDDAIAKQELKTETPSLESEFPPSISVKDEPLEVSPDENGSISDTEAQSDVSTPVEAKGEGETMEHSDPSEGTSQPESLSSESGTYGVTENQVESTLVEVQNETSVEAKISTASNTESTPAENSTVGNSNGENRSPSPQENKTKASISPALVKQLREETGAGMMDCKKALAETGGDIVKAQEFLRRKGLASAEKKASRITAEGRIGSYIHDGRIGVLVEVNCETDFVSRGDIFKELVDDLAMQVAACPNVQYLVPEDVPKEIVSKEKEIEMQKEDLMSKPEQIRSRIVEGRIRKRLEELALLEQPYIKNDKVAVKDWVKQTIATIGENIKVKRFIRYNLGEGLEKKSQDFAAEVAAQTAPKKVAAPTTEKPEAAASKEPAQKSPAVAVSAALVKQLRGETGAGMMDCKKALSETGGDLEKAQEYLRKKGLSTADKKSSRLAAEGRIGSYIHDSRIGVLIEVNCETDFVGRSERFKELVDDLAMQVVACPQVQHVSIEDIPKSIVKKDKELEMQREDLQSKPENIREKIVEGRVSKRLGELALLDQSFIKDDSVLVKDLVKQTVAALGENIKVRRFVRFTLGEASEDAKPETGA